MRNAMLHHLAYVNNSNYKMKIHCVLFHTWKCLFTCVAAPQYICKIWS